MLAVFKRDLISYFTTPIGYVYMAIFLAVNGGAFSLFTLQQGADSSISSYFTAMIFALAILIPILTMKIFSEEKKQKTEQLLMTSPISLGGMVFGKFLAAFTIFTGTLLIGCLNFFALIEYGPHKTVYENVIVNGTETRVGKLVSEYNTGILVGSVIALLLVGAAFIAIGVFVSSLTENQIVSAIATIATMGVFLLIGFLNSYIPFAPIREVLSWLSIYSRFGNFMNGIFDFAAMLYYISITFVFLFLTVRIYEKRRWA
ncbi:MAG: ABC transporter [Ruminococcaceae bacterium]|nr:ABC transporter [Oscillospiraceae bacterium]